MTDMVQGQALAGRKVVFVFCSFELGGAERQGLHLARHLQAQGCDVRVWSTLGGEGPVEAHCRSAGLPCTVHDFRWPCRKRTLVRNAWRWIQALRQERPDVLLPYTTWPNMGCGLTWRWSPVRVCIWGQRNRHGLRGSALERFAYQRVSAVICNAAHEVDYLRNTLGATRAAVHVIANGVELAPCRRPRAAWRAELGIPPDAPVAVMVASVRAPKEHVTLLHAWKEVLATMPNGNVARLLLAGSPQDSFAAVQRLIDELGLGKHVSLLGQVSDVAGLLAASDVGVLASAHEGLSNAVLEYMVAGLPVVATDLPGTREALGDEPRQPYCPPGDAHSLADALRRLFGDPALGRDLGACNRQRAVSEFALETMCRRTVAVIKEALAQSPRSGFSA